jgi:hypothetical protein
MLGSKASGEPGPEAKIGAATPPPFFPPLRFWRNAINPLQQTLCSVRFIFTPLKPASELNVTLNQYMRTSRVFPILA